MTAARSIAAAQTVPKRADVDANVEDHLRLVHAAAEAEVRLLVFPELSLTGYELELARDLAFAEDDPRLAPLVESAATHGMTLVVGAPARLGSRFHIGAFVLSPERTIQLYTKHHLGAFAADAHPEGPGGRIPPAEATVFEPGDRDPLVRFEGQTAAVAVCADTSQPSHPARAAERGARTYLASMFVIPAESEQMVARLSGYAVQHAMTVVFANYGGPTAGMAAGGESAIWSEQGALLARLEERGSGLAIARADETGWRGRAVRLAGV